MAQAVNQIYFIVIQSDGTNSRIESVQLKAGTPPALVNENGQEGKYSLSLFSSNGKELEKQKFNISYVMTIDSNNTTGGMETLAQTSVPIMFQYHKNGVKLVLSDDKGIVETKDISYLADLCGDEICQPNESSFDCSLDCSADGEDDFCNEEFKKTDPDCIVAGVIQEAPTQHKAPVSKYLLFFGGLIIIVGIGTGIYWNEKKK